MKFLLPLIWLAAGHGQSPVPPDQPYAPDAEFHCVADAKATIAKFGKAIADDEQDDMRLYSGSEATSILKFINESPPPTHYKGDSLFVLLHHEKEETMGGGGSVLIFLISDECVTGSLPKMSMGSWVGILHESIGDET
jgi:hypothetical protein